MAGLGVVGTQVTLLWHTHWQGVITSVFLASVLLFPSCVLPPSSSLAAQKQMKCWCYLILNVREWLVRQSLLPSDSYCECLNGLATPLIIDNHTRIPCWNTTCWNKRSASLPIKHTPLSSPTQVCLLPGQSRTQQGQALPTAGRALQETVLTVVQPSDDLWKQPISCQTLPPLKDQ